MNVRITTATAAIVCAALMSGCDRQQAAWQDASQTDTVEAYATYLEAYGDSPEASEARQRISALQAAELWEETEQANMAEAYEQFLAQYPDSEQAEQARMRLAELERQAQWAALGASTDVAALRAFAEQYGDYPEGDAALQRLADVEEAQAREAERLEAERQRRMAEDAARTHRVQLAALRSEDQAGEAATQLAERLADLLGETELETAASGRFYLIRTQPLEEPDARALCQQLKELGQDCLVVFR